MPKKNCLLIGLLLIFSLVLLSNLKLYTSFTRVNTLANEDIIVINHNAKEAKRPDIAINDNGYGVIVWQHKNKDWDIYAQRIRDGEKIGDVFKVNKYTLSNQQHPKVAIDGNGNFVIVWQSYMNGGSGSDVYAQRFDVNGKRIKYEFRLHSDTKFNQISPDVAMHKDGSFVATWVSEDAVMKEAKTTYYKSVKAKFFDKNGKKMSDELKVNSNDYELNTDPSIATNSSGDTIIVWQGNTNADWNIYSQLFDIDGKKKTFSNTLVYFDSVNDQTQPSVTNASDDFIVVWTNKKPHSMFERTMVHIAGQKLNKSGFKSGVSFNVNEPKLNECHRKPSVSSAGDFTAVIWQTFEDSRWKVVYQLFDKKNLHLGDTEELSDSNGNEWVWDVDPIVLLDANNSLNAVWTQMDLKENRKNVVYSYLETDIEKEVTEPEAQN